MSGFSRSNVWRGTVAVCVAGGLVALLSTARARSQSRAEAEAERAALEAHRAAANLQAARDPSAKAEPLAIKDISLDQAHAVLRAAIEKATSMHLKMDIAVVDAGANLKAFARMDDAWLGSIDIAIKKAKTSRFFNMETGALFKLAQPGQSLYGIEVSNGGLIVFPGGVPIKGPDGQVIGAIGVSGSTVEDDEAVATAGAQAAAHGLDGIR